MEVWDMSNEMIRIRKQYKLSDKNIEYINSISEKYKLQSSDALSKIITEHKDISTLESTLKKILLGINNLNKSSEMQLDIINSICIKQNLQEKDFISRTEYTSELISKADKEVAKEICKNNIKKFSK
jgi:hypothetical protein